MDDRLPLRCTCVNRPLLAYCGRDDETGEPWVHVKVWRGQRVFAEMVATSGVVQLRCRDCGRWQRVKIVKGAPRLKEDTRPPQVQRISA